MMEKLERRYVTGVQIEKREEEKGKIKGMAARVGVTYDLGWFEERIEPGAFDSVLTDDVRVLFNHDQNQVLGRTKSKTAIISVDEDGNLMYEYQTPNRSYAKDLEDAIATGDVDQSSFAFVIEEDEWVNRGEGEKELRVIKKLRQLYDVSPVTYPANPDTSVAKRGYEEAKKEWEERQESKEEKQDASDVKANRMERRKRLYSLITTNTL